MHAVEKALDDAERDEAPHVDHVRDVCVLDAPAFERLALPQRAVPFDELGSVDVDTVPGGGQRRIVICCCAGQSRVGQEEDVFQTLGLHVGVGDEGRHLRRGGVYAAELEDVEDEDAAVVEEVGDGGADELVVRVGEQGDLLDAVEAVDVGEDEQHGEIPVGVGEGGEAHGGEGDVVREDPWRWRVGREELDVEGVGGVDGDHAFAVVVEVFQEDFAERVDLARVGCGGVFG